MRKYQFDDLDIQLLGDIVLYLRNYYQDKAPYVLSQSNLLPILSDDPLFVHNYDFRYWGDYIYNEYEDKKTNDRKIQLN